MTIPPAKFQQLLQEAVAHHRSGRLERAESAYRQLLPLAPRNATIHELLGRLMAQQGRAADAIQCFTRGLQADEHSVACGVLLATTLIANNRRAEAEPVLRRLTQKAPHSADAWNALGYVLRVLARIPEALEAHERAVKLNPKYVEGWYQYGLTRTFAGKNFLALGCHDRALAIDPKHVGARFGRAQALHKIYRLPEAIADYDAVLKAEPNHHEARSHRLFASQNVEGITPERLFADHVAYGKAVGSGPPSLPGYDVSPDRRLRLAILSPDLRTHSCAYFLEPLLRHLDRTQFELFLYHDHVQEDAVSARFRALAATWRNFVGQSDALVDRTIRADKPDVLIDLSGHIGITIRLPLLARRVAPVQITYLGYPDTTGLATMDYRFTDAIADPIGTADSLHTERLVRFAPTAWAYQPPHDAPGVSPLACAGGGPVTFGCFGSPTKFTDPLFAAWARLLREVVDARLVLKGRDFDETPVRDHLFARMRAQGIPLEHVDLLPRAVDTKSHLTLYGRVDVVLDTFPYNGTTTTCEALWMGRPVVSILGNRHAARVGASLLTAIGHPEWIAKDVDDYVRVAAELANNRAQLASASSSLREAMQHSPLLDHASQAKRFADAIRTCWRERVGNAVNATCAA